MKTKNQNAVSLGRLGGLAGTGICKARTTEQAARAAYARWAKNRVYPLFSEIDSDLAQRAWTKDRDGYARYTVSSRRINGKQTMTQFRAHRLVVSRMENRELTSSDIVDHINGDRADNRRTNLRLVTKFGNAQNRKCGPFRGTTLLPSGNWQSQVSHKGKTYNLGVFKDRQDAANAAKLKRAELNFTT